MKNLLWILLFLASVCPCMLAQQTYLQVYGQPQIDTNRTNAILQLDDSTYVLGGQWSDIGVLLKVDFKGNLIDHFFINGQVPGTSEIVDMVLDPSGNIIAVGECVNCLPGDTLPKVFAIHTEPSLLFINHKIYEGITPSNNLTRSPSINRKGNQLLLALSSGGPGLNFEDAVLYGITVNLDTLWRKTYNSCGNCGFDHVVDATPTDSGYAFLVLNHFTDSLTLWQVDDLGNPLWKTRHPYSSGLLYENLAYRSGTIYASGTEPLPSGDLGAVVWRFSDGDGSLLGKTSLDVAGTNDWALGLEFSSDGNLLVAHQRMAPNGSGGEYRTSRIYRLDVTSHQVIDKTDIPNPGPLNGIYVTCVAPITPDGAEFAAAGYQNNHDRSFFFSKNSIAPPPPNVFFTATPDTACAPATIVLANNFPGAQAYTWWLDGQQFSSEENPDPLLLTEGGIHLIQLDVQTTIGNAINNFTVTSLPQIWNECTFCDEKPDPYLLIKDAAGTVVYTSPTVESYPPVQLPVSFTLQVNQTYEFEIWDGDTFGSDDFFGSFTIPGNTTGGTFSLINTSDPDTPLEITFTVSPSGGTQSNSQTVVVYKPIVTLVGGNVLQASPGNPAPANYTFQWLLNGQGIPSATADTLVPTVSGTYSVAMITPFCTAVSDSVLFTAVLSATIEGTPPSCFGASDGSLLVTAVGGVPPYSYDWDPATLSGNNPTGLAAGDYSVTVTDAQGQSTTLQTTLAEPSEIALTLQGAAPSCAGSSDGAIMLTVTGGTPPYSVVWAPTGSGTNPTNLPADTYTATVVDANGCTVEGSITLDEPQPLTASTSTTPQISNDSVQMLGTATVEAMGGTPPYTYQWSTTPPQTTPTATGLPNGDYIVTVTDANGCTVEASAHVDFVSRVGEILPVVVRIYPNPSSGQFFIEADLPGPVRLLVFDATGRLALSQERNGLPCTLDLAAQPEGLYFLQIKTRQVMAVARLVLAR